MGKLSDRNALVHAGGLERTRQEWAALFAAAGFKLAGVTATETEFRIFAGSRPSSDDSRKSLHETPQGLPSKLPYFEWWDGARLASRAPGENVWGTIPAAKAASRILPEA